MSESIGSPVSCLTRSSMRSPSRRPGPRKEDTDERLALSKLALNARGSPALLASSFSEFARPRVCSSLSMTHGPAMTSGRSPSPTKIPGAIRTGSNLPPAMRYRLTSIRCFEEAAMKFWKSG